VIRKLTVVLLTGVICLIGVTSALAVKYNEAPMLRVKVAAGELPPVEERLPLEPMVLSAEWNGVPKENIDFEIGQYGGTLRTVRADPNWGPDIWGMNNEPLLSSPGLQAENIRGGVLKDFEVSEDQKVFTFHMREGLKWSDGVPVTTEDILFTYEDFLMNEKLTPILRSWMKSNNRSDGEPMKLDVVDDYTFRISFTEPYGGFPAHLSTIEWKGYTELLKPKHYLKQFHPRYVPLEKLEPLIKEEKLAKGEWWTLFHIKDIINWEFTNPRAMGFPVLSPWLMVKTTPTVVTYERNPYYFKVDTQGNQLPYIDRLRDDCVANVDMSSMKVIAGEVDFLQEHVKLPNLALYKENAEAGGYRVVMLDWQFAPVDISYNCTYPDPVWRKIVRDVRFRKALSMAINREEIIDAVYFGFAELPTIIPSVYDPQKANQLLDEIGLDKRDAEGYRLGPDGKTFVIPIETSKLGTDYVPVTELVIEHWKEVGIKATLKVIDIGLWFARDSANELKATVRWDHLPLWWGLSAWPDSLGSCGMLWNVWYLTNGKEGEEPPKVEKEFFDLLHRLVVVSPQEREELIKKFRDLFYENLFFTPTTQKAKCPLIVSKKLGNVQHTGFAITANFAGEQFFFRQ